MQLRRRSCCVSGNDHERQGNWVIYKIRRESVLGVLHDIDSLCPGPCLVEVFKSGLASSSGLKQVVLPRSGLAACEVVEVGGDASVEPIVEVLEEVAAGAPKVLLELIEVLSNVFDWLAEHSRQVGCDFMHILGLRAGQVVELIAMALRPLENRNCCTLAYIVRADEGVATFPEGRVEEPLSEDVIHLCLE